MQIRNFLIRKWVAFGFVLVVTALTMPFRADAQNTQNTKIVLPLRELSSQELFDSIQRQTHYDVAVNMSRYRNKLSVRVTDSPVSIATILDQLFAGSGITYAVDGNYIVVPVAVEIQAGNASTLPELGTLSGTLRHAVGQAGIPGVEVAILNSSHKTTSDAAGHFVIRNVAAGGHAVRFRFPQQDTVIYRDILVQANAQTEQDIHVSLGRSLGKTDVNAPTSTIIPPEKIANKRYVAASKAGNTTNDAKHTYVLTQPNREAKSYRPKVAVKTNLLYLATTTPNVALEFGLAPRWTFNVAVGVNPWDLNDRKGGIRHALIQPEARYWFCNAFERHFVGIHGIYGRYQVVDVKIPLVKDIRGERYDGWGVGAGIAYGYHLPVAPRWAFEFSVGAGYVYFDYKEYNCGDCDSYKGKADKHYIGPTKATVSLVFMIR